MLKNCGWWAEIHCIMKKIRQYPTHVHTLCSAAKAQYSTTSLIQNTITYTRSMQHSLRLAKHRIFLYSLPQSIEYTVNPQFKAILQASHYHNFNSKYYIFLTIHINTNTGQLCVQFYLTATNTELLARNAHREPRTRVWPSFRQPKFSCMCTEFVLNGISVTCATITLECQLRFFSSMEYKVERPLPLPKLSRQVH
jgi:hypothetical protein